MKRIIRTLLCAFCLSTLSGAVAHAVIRVAASCNVSDVQSAINAASNGDVVVIPNGSCSWTTGIASSAQITLRGESVGGVTITHNAGSSDLLRFTIGSSFNTTIASLRFMPGTGRGNYLTVQGTGLVPLLHDCYFNLPNFQLQHAVQWFVKGGVIWNTTFESTDYGSSVYGSDSGCLVVKPTTAWGTPSTMGTLDTKGDVNLYIEDSIFRYVGQCPDVDDNGRVVVRQSQIIGSSGLTHGTTSSQGGRHVELYDNTFTYPNTNRNLNRYFWFRAGTAVITGNSIQWINGQGYGSKPSFTFVVENARRAGAHGCCTGYMCFHQPGSGSDGVLHSPAYTSSGQSDAYQVPDPVYIWGNTGTGSGLARIGLNEGEPADCGTTYKTANFFVLNRDYFVDSMPKPGWSRYAYPHPLRQSTGLPAPTRLRIIP